MNQNIFYIFVLLFHIVYCEELSFELPDREQMCFHEILEKDVQAFLEFQVIEGGNYDVDVLLHDPHGTIIYTAQKKQYDRFEFTSRVEGEYIFCFSNEFSTFTHKFVYFEFAKDDSDLNRIDRNLEENVPMTQLEASMATMRRRLLTMSDFQTHHRMREAQGRGSAESLNEKVQYWSIGQTVFVLLAGLGQILVLKSLFTEKKATKTTT